MVSIADRFIKAEALIRDPVAVFGGSPLAERLVFAASLTPLAGFHQNAADLGAHGGEWSQRIFKPLRGPIDMLMNNGIIVGLGRGGWLLLP